MSNKKSKIEKKIGIKSFLRNGKRVRSFRRRQKVNREENKARNRLLVGLGTTAALGIGGIAAAKLIKKAKNKKLANAAKKVKPDIPAPSPVPQTPASPSPSPKSNLELRTDIPDSVKPFLDDYGYNPPKEPLLPNAKKPESYQSIITDPNNSHIKLIVPNEIGYVDVGVEKALREIKDLEKFDAMIRQEPGEAIRENGAVAQFIELSDGTGYMLRVQKNPIRMVGRDKRGGGYMFDFKIPKDVDPRYLDLKPFDDLITPNGQDINVELASIFDKANNIKNISVQENPKVLEGYEYMKQKLKENSWKPLDSPNPRIKSIFEVLEMNQNIRGKDPDNKLRKRFWDGN